MKPTKVVAALIDRLQQHSKQAERSGHDAVAYDLKQAAHLLAASIDHECRIQPVEEKLLRNCGGRNHE